MPVASVNAIGRLWPGDPRWYGIGRLDAAAPDGEAGDEASGYRLIFGEADGSITPAAARDRRSARRDLLLALIAFFEGDSGDPPPELEMTQWEAAETVAWLAHTASAEAQGERESLLLAVDAIDDGLASDVVIGHLYAALERAGETTTPPGEHRGASVIEELRLGYRSLVEPQPSAEQ